MIDRDDLAVLAATVGRITREFVTAAISSLKTRIDDVETLLERRIEDSEERIKDIPAGPKGEKGERGETGLGGERGEKGERGEPGEKGLAGQKGDSGDAGEKGEKGDRGLTGDAGPAGPKGGSGDPGQPGPKGETGETGAPGLKGIDGKDGRDGREGKDGRDGEDGRDALQIEILPAIDPQKSYPRGTFAQYKGGLLRAICHTDPAKDGIAGWDVIVDAEADFAVIQSADLRTFSVKRTMLSGKTFEFSFQIPVTIHRGIFRDGTEYARGDQATYDNSTWTCFAESTKAKPGTSPDWQLSARKGDRGKDGKGEKGDPGQPGKDGKDYRPLDGGKW